MSIIHGTWSFIMTHKIKVFIAVLAVIGVIYAVSSTTEEVLEDDATLPVVTVTSAAQILGQQEVSIIGTVRAFSEAAITAEATGQVTSVNATLGETVSAGFVIATLENASERAAVLQAEGVYESALAAAQQSDVGLDEATTGLLNAQNNAVSAFSTAYSTVNGIIRNNVDSFFSNPENSVPGLRIDGQGQTQFLNQERIAYRTLLSEWQTETTALTTSSDLNLALSQAVVRTDRTIALVDTFLALFSDDDRDTSYTEAELIGFSTTFTTLRNTLVSTKASLNTAITSLDNANDAIRRAQIGATGSQSSAADAQVKQALGSLRAAQANLAKTILRTPISGTVNAIDVRTGDFVGNQQVIARVANNNALEIVTFVGDAELNAFAIGSTVTIEDTYEGIVTEVAPAVDPVTRKTEVRIAIETEDIQNGDTVTIKKVVTTETVQNQPILIPLSAVKFEIDDGYIFVVQDAKLQSRPVELGIVRGGSVEIVSGLTIADEFVVDARGLLPNTEVEVRNQ